MSPKPLPMPSFTLQKHNEREIYYGYSTYKAILGNKVLPGYLDNYLAKTGLMMKIAMLIGFITAYPVNWWQLKKGIKEARSFLNITFTRYLYGR